jgi:serine/threonine protein phosphatase PrpC
MKFTIFEDSRIGRRPYQQDRIAHWKTRDALFLVVADGMGGAVAGEVASRLAVETVVRRYREGEGANPLEDLRLALELWPHRDNPAVAPLNDLHREAQDRAALEALLARVMRARP